MPQSLEDEGASQMHKRNTRRFHRGMDIGKVKFALQVFLKLRIQQSYADLCLSSAIRPRAHFIPNSRRGNGVSWVYALLVEFLCDLIPASLALKQCWLKQNKHQNTTACAKLDGCFGQCRVLLPGCLINSRARPIK